MGWKNRIEESFSKKSSGNKDEMHVLDMKLFPDAGDNFGRRSTQVPYAHVAQRQSAVRLHCMLGIDRRSSLVEAAGT